VDLANVLSPELAKLPWVKGLANIRPVKLNAKLAGFAKDFAAEQVDLRLGTYESAEFRLTGSINNVPAQRGVKLNFSVRGQKYETLKKLLGSPTFLPRYPVAVPIAYPAKSMTGRRRYSG
jgi:hypothetical protein